MSTKSAGLAKKLGYKNIKVMLAGAPGWKKTGNQLFASDSFVQKGNIILVDLRPESESALGHIARSVNIPYDELDDFRDDFDPKAPVVLYGDHQKDAYKKLVSWKLKGVALISGGLHGYQERGGQLVSGAPETDIEWLRKLGKGEVDKKTFLKAAEEGSTSQVVLDIRGAAETTEGKFANAINIPLDNLEARMTELPKDKEILIHCSTGDRAEMAHALLQKAGYKTRFLIADVSCKGNVCTVE